MCKYCENTEEFTSFIEKEYDFLPGTKLLVTGGINAKMLLDIVGDFGHEVFHLEEKINYCPICGRKF